MTVLVAVGEHGHLDLGFSVGSLALRVILLAAVLAVAAFALLRGFLGEPGRFTTIAVTVAAVAAAAMELLLSGGLNLPDQVVPLLLLALALPLYLILSSDERFAAVVGLGRRLAPLVFVVVAALAAVQFGRAVLVSAGAVTALHTGVLLGLVALVWFAVANPRGRGVTAAMRVGAALLGVALLAGAAQAITARAPDPVPGVATQVRLEVGGTAVDVLVVPNLPGWNLVHVSSATAAVGTSSGALEAAESRPGATGGWLAVELPAGRSDIWVRDAGDLDSFSTDTGSTGAASRTFAGPDGPECASAMLAAGTDSGASCPSEELDPLDAAALRTMVEAVARQGHAQFALAGDQSPRGLAADDFVRAAAAARGVEVVAPGTAGAPLLLTSGWADAATLLNRVAAGEVPADSTYLAPWLHTGPLLDCLECLIPDARRPE